MNRPTVISLVAILSLGMACSCKKKPGETTLDENSGRTAPEAPPAPESDNAQAGSGPGTADGCSGYPIRLMEWLPDGTGIVVDNA